MVKNIILFPAYAFSTHLFPCLTDGAARIKKIPLSLCSGRDLLKGALTTWLQQPVKKNSPNMNAAFFKPCVALSSEVATKEMPGPRKLSFEGGQPR